MSNLSRLIKRSLVLVLVGGMIGCAPWRPRPQLTEGFRDPAGGGVIQGGGGGNFDLAIFWDQVDRSLVPGLQNNGNLEKLFTKEQARALIELMKKGVVDVEIVDEDLKVLDNRGKEVRVDAVNLPEKKEIRLFRPTWQFYFTKGMEFRHLILHEFMGLAGIPDLAYSVSSRAFQPREKPVSFYYQKMSCEIRSWFMVWNGQAYTIRNFYAKNSGQNSETPFSKAERKGRSDQNCEDPLPPIRVCKDVSRLVKEARLHLEYEIPQDIQLSLKQRGLKTESLPQYSVEVIATLEGEAFENGWGAAANHRTFLPPLLSLYQQAQMKSAVGVAKVLSAHEEGFWKFPEDSGETLSLSLFNPDLQSALLRDGVRLQIDQDRNASGGGSGLMNVYNFSKVLSRHALTKGASRNGIDAYWKKSLFSEMPDFFPIVMYGSCSFSK